ncbi:MAG: hypothetical protein V4501_11865 [Pseudomonadota bacterium]
MTDQICPVCCGQAKVAKADHALHVYCHRCCDFFIDKEVVDDFQKELKDIVITAKISGWARENQRVKIDNKTFVWLVNKLEVPNVYEKAQRLIKWLNKKTVHPGQAVPIMLLPQHESLIELLSVCWACNDVEVNYLISYLLDKNYLTINRVRSYEDFTLTITPLGFSYIEEIQKNLNSNLGFCAMWFDESVKPAWEQAIEPAIKAAGYEAKRIDAHPHNGVIVDEIIALIRGSKFVVADLTGSRGGVYYEAGFAKGFGLETIFTCREDCLSDLHFDVRHYNFLKWDSSKYEEFKKNLIFRIESTLGRGNK